MRAIKTFFSLTLLFVFSCVIAVVIFSVDVFLRHNLSCFHLHTLLSLYLEVLFYSFPLALVASALLCVFLLVRSKSFSGATFFYTFFAISFLGFYGLHYLVQERNQDEKRLGNFVCNRPFEKYAAKNAYFLFRATSGNFLKDIVAVEVSKPIGALGFYGEGLWDEKKQTLSLLPASAKESSLVLQPCLNVKRGASEPFGSTFALFFIDIYYVSYFFMTQTFGIFLLNLIAFVFFIFAVSHFSSPFSGIISGMVILCLLRFIFWAYRFMVFDMSYIIQDFGLFSLTTIAYFPFIFVMLVSLALTGVWRLVCAKKTEELEKA